MTLLAIDPGAKRLGYSVFDKKHKELICSGILGLDRAKDSDISYQDYKICLIEYYMRHIPLLIKKFNVDELIIEIVPVKGNFNDGSQLALAAVSATCVIAASYIVPQKVDITQVAASTVKKRLTGNGRATKVMIRNKVLELYPYLLDRKEDFKKIFDEIDAIAIGHISLK